MVSGQYAISGLPTVYEEDEKAVTLEICLEDPVMGVEVTLKYGVLEDLDVITRCAVIKNTGSKTVFISKAYSATIDFLSGDFELLHFQGRHTMERNLERIPVIHGSQTFGSLRGTSSHQHNPFFILAEKGTTEDFGSCYGMSFLYSGNFRFEIEKDQFQQTRMQMGIQDEIFDYPLDSGNMFHTPEVAMSYTSQGLATLSHIYHRLIRYHVCWGKYKTARRSVLINSWEAAYMDFDEEKIISIAKQASEIGVEMFVLDDGWFANRDTDNSGLGDWYVNKNKISSSPAWNFFWLPDQCSRFPRICRPKPSDRQGNRDQHQKRGSDGWMFWI